MLNLPNILTLARLPLLFVILGLMYVDQRWALTWAFALFLLGTFTDWLDGYLARSMNLVTTFGKLMDALVDKIFVIGMFVGLLVVPFPELPPVALGGVLIIITREFVITGLRLVAATRGLVLASESVGKYKTAAQMGAIATLIFSEAIFRDFNASLPVAGFFYWTGYALFWLAVGLTGVSGAIYLAKYVHVFDDRVEEKKK